MEWKSPPTLAPWTASLLYSATAFSVCRTLTSTPFCATKSTVEEGTWQKRREHFYSGQSHGGLRSILCLNVSYVETGRALKLLLHATPSLYAVSLHVQVEGIHVKKHNKLLKLCWFCRICLLYPQMKVLSFSGILCDIVTQYRIFFTFFLYKKKPIPDIYLTVNQYEWNLSYSNLKTGWKQLTAPNCCIDWCDQLFKIKKNKYYNISYQ